MLDLTLSLPFIPAGGDRKTTYKKQLLASSVRKLLYSSKLNKIFSIGLTYPICAARNAIICWEESEPASVSCSIPLWLSWLFSTFPLISLTGISSFAFFAALMLCCELLGKHHKGSRQRGQYSTRGRVSAFSRSFHYVSRDSFAWNRSVKFHYRVVTQSRHIIYGAKILLPRAKYSRGLHFTKSQN